jgi:hypothetical protein
MKKSKTAYLREENLLTLLSQNNFIVPEIQREYVWGNNEKVVVTFLRELKKKVGEICEQCHQPHSSDKINIGFLYSYKPDYVQVKQERFLDENLIDGQQRFTTLFLLLFYCALKENKKRDFLALIRFEEDLSMSFDFKVRDLTRRFLLEFVNKTDSIDQIKGVQELTWFLADYKNDLSIQAMIKTLKYIIEEFDTESQYYHHFLSNVVFWHFKTEATSQGEELYITMNARGEELADNEITKAALMPEGVQLLESGKKWEEWQQFFWKNRDKKAVHQSADAGFNSFLQCIAGFEYYRLTALGHNVERDQRQLLNIGIVENYFDALKYLNENVGEFQNGKNYCDWLGDALKLFWQLINRSETDWFADYNDDNKGTERSRMVFVWSVLFYILTCKDENKLTIDDTYRFLRLHYVKFNNYDRSVSGIVQNVRTALIHGPLHLHGTPEEIKKHIFIKKFEEPFRSEVEQVIWEIEDKKLNLNGRDLSAVNISHLIDFDQAHSLEDVIKVKDAFEQLFPGGATDGSSLLKSTLLFKGEFWKDASLSYYSRYDFSDWRRHIRKPAFKDFFDEFIENNFDLQSVFQHSITQFILSNREVICNAVNVLPSSILGDRLRYYAILIEPEIMWEEGEFIAIHHDVPEGESRLFENENKVIYNSKGSFHGYSGNLDLWNKAVELHSDPLNYLKEVTLATDSQ